MVSKPLLVALVLAVLFAGWTWLSNPLRQFSTEAYWRDATLSDVELVPQEALEPGNKNGPVLMWAAAVTKNPDIIAALVKRGADVNAADFRATSSHGKIHSDERIQATALSAAAFKSTTPEIIEELFRQGAKLDTRHSYGRTALMIAASSNRDERITAVLLELGADPLLVSDRGKTALDIAMESNNKAVVNVLQQRLAEMSPQ